MGCVASKSILLELYVAVNIQSHQYLSRQNWIWVNDPVWNDCIAQQEVRQQKYRL